MISWQTTIIENKNVAATFAQRHGNGPSGWKRLEEKGGRKLRSAFVYEVAVYPVVPALNISARLTLQKRQFFFTFSLFLFTYLFQPQNFSQGKAEETGEGLREEDEERAKVRRKGIRSPGKR